MNMYLDDAPAFFGEDIITFGSFQLNRTQRTLLKNGSPLTMGCRAMEILLALTEKAGAIVSNRELLRRVWPNIVVEGGTVRVHVALLRKALRGAEPGSDYVHSVTGRGYCFVADVSRHQRAPESHSQKNNLPSLLTPVFGRERTVRAVAASVARLRLVTIAGAGGIGKTTVAIKTAALLAETHAPDVCFVDLSVARRTEEICNVVAAALGVTASLPAILAYLSKQSMLIVLDNCEHLIEAARSFAESVLRNCAGVNILATSREPLRADGELVHELAAWEWPATFDARSRREVLQFPATRLFIERAGAYAGIEIDDAELPMVADICRRLACNPLAIEIAAGQVRWVGMRALSACMSDTMYLAIEGRRTAEHRHRTLRQSFDWSYDLLSHEEQEILARLSAFVGDVSPDFVASAIANERLTRQQVRECLASLARKSLLAVDARESRVMYRLDGLPWAYAREKFHHLL